MIYRIKNFKLSRAIIPNTFTALNLFFGFYSIILASMGEIKLSAVFIFIAALFDLLDGMVARFLKSTSEFGVELDSLADLVSFGAAPSFLVYQSYLHQFGFLGAVISSMPLILGSFRLARFNIQIEDLNVKSDFKGLAIPLQALPLASYIWFYFQNGSIVKPFDNFVIPLVVILSFLMVTNIKYNKLPKPKDMSLLIKNAALVFILLAVALIYFTDGEALFYIFFILVMFGVLRYFFNLIFNSKTGK
ncbi:CDP-diacylglycerol--serine O-phosphatidyltransferase [Bacteroidota bacterium]